MDALFPETSSCGREAGRDASALENVAVRVSRELDRDCAGAEVVSVSIGMAIK